MLQSSRALCSQVALITGITGQDGSYLAQLLLSKNYIVHGIVRRSSSFNTQRIDHLYSNQHLHLHYGDMNDGCALTSLIAQTLPTQIYHLAAQSHVRVSFDSPEYTGQTVAMGTIKLLEAIRLLNLQHSCKFYNAATSEMYGETSDCPQNENTPFHPRSPYAAAKLYAYHMVTNYRNAYQLCACNGILFNHESPRRGKTFVTQKIVRAAVRIRCGMQKMLKLGNLYAQRDWGHAKDYVYGMWSMLQHTSQSRSASLGEDWVLATGEAHSVKQFCQKSFKYVGYDLCWQGDGMNEIAYDFHDKALTPLICVEASYFRPTQVARLIGDATKARTKLGWHPTYSFDQLVADMMSAQITAVQNGQDR